MNNELIARNIDALPDKERDRLLRLKQNIRRPRGKVGVNFKFVGMINGLLNGLLSRDGRLTFYEWLFERRITTSRELTVPEMFGLVDWLRPQGGNGHWEYDSAALVDAQIVLKVFGGGVGQDELPMTDSLRDVHKAKQRRAERIKTGPLRRTLAEMQERARAIEQELTNGDAYQRRFDMILLYPREHQEALAHEYRELIVAIRAEYDRQERRQTLTDELMGKEPPRSEDVIRRQRNAKE